VPPYARTVCERETHTRRSAHIKCDRKYMILNDLPQNALVYVCACAFLYVLYVANNLLHTNIFILCLRILREHTRIFLPGFLLPSFLFVFFLHIFWYTGVFLNESHTHLILSVVYTHFLTKINEKIIRLYL